MKRLSMVRQIRIQKLQNKNHVVGMGFNVLGPNQRRKFPWLGSYWYKEATKEEREAYIRQYQEETEKMIKINPDLELV